MFILKTVFGNEANRIAEFLGLQKSGDQTDVNTKVMFLLRSVEGHSVIDLWMDI